MTRCSARSRSTCPDTTVGELNASSRALMGVLAPEIQAALLGDKSPEDALKDAATRCGTAHQEVSSTGGVRSPNSARPRSPSLPT